jgi:hypothetical protein
VSAIGLSPAVREGRAGLTGIAYQAYTYRVFRKRLT